MLLSTETTHELHQQGSDATQTINVVKGLGFTITMLAMLMTFVFTETMTRVMTARCRGN